MEGGGGRRRRESSALLPCFNGTRGDLGHLMLGEHIVPQSEVIRAILFVNVGTTFRGHRRSHESRWCVAVPPGGRLRLHLAGAL